MRKHSVLLWIALCFSFLPLHVFAQDSDKGLGVGLGIRAGFVDIKDSGLSGVDAELDTARAAGVTGTFNLGKYFSLEAALDHAFRNEIVVRRQGVSAELGDFSQTAATLGLRLHIPTGTRFTPYLGGGGGYFFNDFTTSSAINSTLPGTTAFINDDVGYFANVGAEFLFARNKAFCVDLRGFWNETDAIISIPRFGTTSYNVDLLGAMGTVGLKYYF